MEDNNQNRPSTSSFDADYHMEIEEFSSDENLDTSDSEEESPPSKKRKTYQTGRAKCMLHGNDYQLKLLMLFALNGKNCGVKFSLATEKFDSKFDEFDDLIFRYEDKGKIKYRFLQAKHCFSGNKIIKINDLLSEKDTNIYSLQRYFKSYLIYDQQYIDGDLEDLIICSNYSFDPKTTGNYLEEKSGADPILNLGGKIYQFKKSKKTEIINELKPIFEEALLEKRKKGKVIFLNYLSEITGIRDRSLLENDCLNKIGDFLDKLVFAVEQPSGAELEEEIADNMGNEFNLINKSTYNKFYTFMSKWMQTYEKDGTKMVAQFLTHNELKNFIDEAKGEIASLGMVCSNLLYRAKMEDSKIKFNEEIKECQNIKNFLEDDEKQILIMYHSKSLLSGIKVCQLLENKRKSDQYIFLDIKYLSILQSSASDPLTAFKNSARNLVIIEYNCKKKENMLKPFIKVLRDNAEKKIILVTSKEQKNSIGRFLDNLLKKLRIDKNTKYSEFEDKGNNLTDLSDESQERLLEKKGVAIFQGKEITLSSLIETNTKYLISGQVLCMLINNEQIEIGKEIVDHRYDEIKEHYIQRMFYRSEKINETVENEKSQYLISSDDKNLVLTPEDYRDDDESDDEKPVINPEDNRDDDEKPVINPEDYSDDDDNEKGYENSVVNSVMANLGSELVWQLNGFLFPDEDALPISINNDRSSIKQDSINDEKLIIVSEPGMGKSMLLTYIALQKKESDPSLLVMHIKLVEYSSQLNNLKTDNNNESFVKFLYKTFLKKYTKLTEQFLNSITITIEDHTICIKDNESKIDDVTWLEVQLFNEFYNNGKVIFFFDGFDEICPDYKVEIIKLLKVLKGSRSRIWITTRPYDISEELENELGVLPYRLERFSEYEQQSYLKKFWRADDQRSNIFVTGLLEHFSKSTSDVERNFLGIPLHLNMLAVVFKKEFKDWYDSGNELFFISDDNKELLNNLNYLYEKFIDIKFVEIYIKEKMPSLNTHVPSIRHIIIDQHKRQFLKDHSNLAVYSLLNERKVKLFLSEKKLNEMPKKIEDIKHGKEKTGIISSVSDNKPVFVHRTFAEYFLSHFIYDKLTSCSDANYKLWEFLLKRILIDAEYSVIRRFLNCLLADYKVDNIKSEIIKKVLKDIIVGRSITPLHVASIDGSVGIVKFLLENQPDELENVPEKFFINDNLFYNFIKFILGPGEEKSLEKKFINVKYGELNALEYALVFQREEIVRLLLENGAGVSYLSLFIASCPWYFSEPVCEVLLDYNKNDELKLCSIESIQAQFLMWVEKFLHVNIQDKDGNTRLHIAAMVSKDSVVDLLEKGIDIEYQGRETSQMISKLLDTCAKVRRYLLKRGVIIKTRNYYGSRKINWVSTVELFLKNGEDENILNNNGKRPIDLVPDFNDFKKYLHSVDIQKLFSCY